MSYTVDIMNLATVRKIMDEAQTAIKAETGEDVKLKIMPYVCGLADGDFILGLTCSLLGITAATIRNSDRRQHLVDARRIAVMLCRDYLEYNWGDIGKLLNRDRTSVMHLYTSAAALLQTNCETFVTKWELVQSAFTAHFQKQ